MAEKKEEKKKDTDLISVQPEILALVDKADLNAMDYGQLVELGLGVLEVKAYSQWLLGKLGDIVSQKYGDLTRYAKDTRQNLQVLQQYMYTYRKFTSEDPAFSPDKYCGSLPWGMLQLVATKTDKPIELLNELVDKGVGSFEHAYREIKTKETGKIVPRKPHIGLIWDYEKSKWRIDLLPEDFPLIDWSDIRERLLSYLNGLT